MRLLGRWTILRRGVFPQTVLRYGRTYSIQVQVKDALGVVYPADKRAWIHTNASTVPAPMLTAEPDCTTADAVVLVWSSEPPGDGDTITYTVELSSTVIPFTWTFDVGSNLSLDLGRLEAETYSWRVYAEDGHSVGAWSSADTFVVTQAGVLPVVTLLPIQTSTNTTPLSQWRTVDLQDFEQTDYQVQIDNDPAFGSINQDSGATVSGHMYHQHTALATGTWYRRVKARTYGSSWSDWTSDSFVIDAGTSQSNDWDIYRDAEGTPTLLDPAVYPVTGLTVTRRLDGPTEFSFTINNFDGLEGNITNSDCIELRLKDSAGKRILIRGYVIAKSVGQLCMVRCADISYRFQRWEAKGTLTNKTLGNVIKSLVEYPDGAFASNIVTHVAECEDPEVVGKPITMKSWAGENKTVASWLSHFQTMTGFVWWVDWEDGAWHFYWQDPDTFPDWTVSLKDGIDYADESATQWKLLPGSSVQKSMEGYANRIVYRARYAPYSLPPGFTDWDEVFSDSVDLWHPYTGVTVAFDVADKWAGDGSICFTKTWTGPVEVSTAQTVDFGYFDLPVAYKDLQNTFLMEFQYRLKAQYLLNGGNFKLYNIYPTYDQTPNADGSTISQGVDAQVMVEPMLYSGQDVGPTGGVQGRATMIDPRKGTADANKWTGGQIVINISQIHYSPVDAPGFDVNNVRHIGFRWTSGCPSGHRRTSTIANGSTWVAKLWIDNLQLRTGGPSMQEHFSGDRLLGESQVETAAVTAGTEFPITLAINNPSMTTTEARALALRWLDIVSAAKVTVSGLSLPGIRNIPRMVDIPLVLTEGPVLTATYPLREIHWAPADSGWTTTLIVGTTPSDVSRAMEKLSHGFKDLAAETR